MFYLALFLTCAEKYSYLNLHDGYCVDSNKYGCRSKLWMKRLPEYERPLGAPKGPAVQHGNIFKREFKHASVLLDVNREVGEIIWKK